MEAGGSSENGASRKAGNGSVSANVVKTRAAEASVNVAASEVTVNVHEDSNSDSIARRVKRRRYRGKGSRDGVETVSPSVDEVHGPVLPVNRPIGPRLFPNTTEKKDPLPLEIQKLIGNFLYGTGCDLIGHEPLDYEMPSREDLKGWILTEKVQEMREYVSKIKESWTSTGCSILLDAWVDDKGRDLISFFVDCPEGPVYLRSADITSDVRDENVEALFSLVDRVIEEEVGFDNVIQIVASSTERWVGAVYSLYHKRNKKVFWTFDASYCIGIILEYMGTMERIRKILDGAKTITKFIYEHPSVLKLFKSNTSGHDLIVSFNIDSAIPFIALRNLKLMRQQVKDMFSSSEWKGSTSASTVEGKRAADLVLEDHSFWIGAEMITKATSPLVHVLHSIYNADKPLVGYIYKAMDDAKEIIKSEFMRRNSDYTPFWDLIDEVWTEYLHSPLHAAGYYLNPGIFSFGILKRPEVYSGLFLTFIRMVPDACSETVLPDQMTKYSRADGAFKAGIRTSRKPNITPAQWWTLYGTDCPELQRCAVRVLSQTCLGVSRYGLKRSMAEKLLAKRKNSDEQQYMTDLTFVHYNMHLAEQRSGLRNASIKGEVDPVHDWIMGKTQRAREEWRL